MFNCQAKKCRSVVNGKSIIKPGDKPVKIVIETRPKEYPEVLGPPKGWNREPTIIDAGGVGFETVKELTLCTPCAKARAKKEAAA